MIEDDNYSNIESGQMFPMNKNQLLLIQPISHQHYGEMHRMSFIQKAEYVEDTGRLNTKFYSYQIAESLQYGDD